MLARPVANGNMTGRTVGGQNYTLGYDAENHLTSVSGAATASFVYDGDGKRVQSSLNGVTTTFVGSYFEWTGSTSSIVRYYYAGGARLAKRTGSTDLIWLFTDHLGSTVKAVAAGSTPEQRYKAWGETRLGSLPTNYRYTGQYEQPEIGLYYYGARWYDTALGRWVQPDTIVPDNYNPLDMDRYQYTRSNPVRNTDPSGHEICMDGHCGRPYDQEHLIDYWAGMYRLKFVGDWSRRNMWIVIKAVIAVGRALAGIITVGSTPHMNSGQAFRSIFNGIAFQWGNCSQCMGGGGYTYGAHKIGFESLADDPERAVHNVVHELGHAFDWVVSGVLGRDNMPRNIITRYWDSFRRPEIYSSQDVNQYGLAGPVNQRNWHQNPEGSPGEEFADTFLAWVYDSWQNSMGVYTPEAKDRINFMTQWMPLWVNTIVIQ